MTARSRTSSDEVLRILVVEDDEVDRLAIRRHLKAAGLSATIDELADAATIVETATEGAYDCILLDHFLPGETGLDVITRVRDAGVTTPILCVASPGEEVGAALVAAGATDFLDKDDLSPGRLRRRILYAIRLGRAERRADTVRGELEHQRVLMRSVLAHLPVGVAVVDVSCTSVLMANARAQEVLGDEARLLAAADDPTPIGQVARATVSRAMADGAAVDAAEAVVDRTRCYRISAGPVRDGDGQLLGGVISLADVTDEVAARQVAERASRARAEMLAVVSHDLRGPLSSINVAADGLRDTELDGADRIRYVDAIQRSVQRGDRLIRDLLDATLIDAGRLTVDVRPVAVAELLRQAARDHELTAGQQGVTLDVVVADGVGEVRADRDRVLQALGNLVGNALRHGRGTARIELAGARTDVGVALSVRDHGPGIPAAARAHIFDRYWQGRERRGGAGLGLAIVRGIAEAHGGTVAVSAPDDGGACITIVLPA